jgi:hypothetical protein
MKKTVAANRPMDVEIDRAITRARAHDRAAPRILTARYERPRDAIVLGLSTGAVLAVPRAAVPGVASIDPAKLKLVEVEPPGYSIWFELPDVGVRLETLLQAALGPQARGIAARTLGTSTSPAKVAAVRANGALGGRPLTMAAFVRHLDRALHLVAPNAPDVFTADNCEPNSPNGAQWAAGKHRLQVRVRGSQLEVNASWRKPSFEPRNRAVAHRLAEEFAAMLSRRREGLRRRRRSEFQ